MQLISVYFVELSLILSLRIGPLRYEQERNVEPEPGLQEVRDEAEVTLHCKLSRKVQRYNSLGAISRFS